MYLSEARSRLYRSIQPRMYLCHIFVKVVGFLSNFDEISSGFRDFLAGNVKIQFRISEVYAKFRILQTFRDSAS